MLTLCKGALMNDRVVTPYEGTGHRSWDDGAAIDAPLRLHEATVRPEWVDYNGHMSESCYLLVFGDSADAFFRFVGIDEDYRAAGHSLYTVQTHLHHRREAAEGELLACSLQLVDHDDRRLHIYHEMRHGETGVLLAAAEQLLVHVDMAAGRSSPLPADVRERVVAVHRAHSALARSDLIGKPLVIRHQ
jgi:acyl-CoA thioester hydrolase